MREIKFRGLRKDIGYFVYGLPYNNVEFLGEYIVDGLGNEHEIKEGTLGQFTGLYDSKGNEIYEGDILKTCKGEIIVNFAQGIFGFYKDVKASFFNDETQSVFYSLYSVSDDEIKVIGNSHD